jgi:hypothetical protein
MSVIAAYVRLSETSLAGLRANPDWLEALDRDAVADAEQIDIDKACDGIVWLLSRLPPPAAPAAEGAGFLLQRNLATLVSGEGGRKEPTLHAPYGPASSLSPGQVAELSGWLERLDTAQLREAYDPKAMATDDVYPQIWMRDREAAWERYLLPRLEQLRGFLARAAAAQQAVLVFFT